MALGDVPGLKANYLIIFVGGTVLVISSILVFLLVIQGVYGDFKLMEIAPTPENLSSKSPMEINVGVLYSKYTENMLVPEGNTWLNDNVTTWETFLKSSHISYTLINDQTIELGKHFDYDIIVLPGCKALSDKENSELKKYLDRGGSIFATGGTSSYDNSGKWRGWDFFTEVYGLKFSKEINPEEYYQVHTLRGNLPLTAGIPTGYALKIATWDRPIYAEIFEPRTTQASFWYDFRREAGLVREEVRKSAGIAFGTYGRGRYVWYGFELNSIIGKQEDYIFFDRLFRNSMNWLSYAPTAFVKDWPSPYSAAAIFIPTLNENAENLGNLKQIINSIGVKPTIFIDAGKIQEDSIIARTVSSYGELGAIIDVGYLDSFNDTINKLYDKDYQYKLFKSSQYNFNQVTNSSVKGIMPLFGFYDENTLQAMSKYNYDYIITDSLTDRSVPKVIVRNEKPILLITKTARDDYEVIREYGLTDIEFQKYTYEEDIDRVVFEGGLYVLKVHSDYQLKPEYAQVIPALFKYMKTKNIWITTISQLKDWWLKRGGIEIRFDTRSKRRIAVEVSNPVTNREDSYVVEVYVNKDVRDIKISSDIINTKLPDSRYDPNSQTLYLFVDKLKAGESRSFLIDYQNLK
ncbi:MAG: hypothetical protein V1773_05580 [bacterium]